MSSPYFFFFLITQNWYKINNKIYIFTKMNIYREDITNDYQQFFEEDYNVIIHVGEEPNIKKFHAHSIILRCRSQYFRLALSSNWAEKKDGMYILRKPNISGNIFQIILR